MLSILTWCSSFEPEFHDRVEAAWQAWADATPCSGWSEEDLGDCETAGDVDVRFISDDPDDQLEEGVFSMIVDNTVTFNDTPWSSDADVAAGTCKSLPNLDLWLRHAVGRVGLGLPLTCTGGEDCTADQSAAVLAPYLPLCDDRQPNDADVVLVWSAHGPIDLSPRAEPFVGPAPLEVCVSLPAGPAFDAANSRVSWDFGDGTTTEGFDACYTYNAPGTKTIKAEVTTACGVKIVDPYATVNVEPAIPTEEEPAVPTCGCDTTTGGMSLVGMFVLGLAVLRRRV